MSKTMTAEELERELAIKQGGEMECIEINGTDYLLWNVPDHSEVGTEPPPYLTDIAAAWLLIQLVLDEQHTNRADRRYRWSEYWNTPGVPILYTITDPAEAARHICLAAYYALIGERAEIVEAN